MQVWPTFLSNDIKKYKVGLELYYSNGIRIEDSKGIAIYNGSTLLSNNKLSSSENNIYLDLTDLIENEMKKYRQGRDVSNIKWPLGLCVGGL